MDVKCFSLLFNLIWKTISENQIVKSKLVIKCNPKSTLIMDAVYFEILWAKATR